MPQIVHNHKTRCAGLSLAMFFFSITGNVTYVASILFKSTDRRYLLTNLSWLWCVSLATCHPQSAGQLIDCRPRLYSGSGLTVFLDIIVLLQFVYFSRQAQPLLLAAVEEDQE